MKRSHNIIESSKNPKRKLTGEAAIFRGEKHVSAENRRNSIVLSKFREKKHEDGVAA